LPENIRSKNLNAVLIKVIFAAMSSGGKQATPAQEMIQ
jgi:hypothetical protein